MTTQQLLHCRGAVLQTSSIAMGSSVNRLRANCSAARSFARATATSGSATQLRTASAQQALPVKPERPLRQARPGGCHDCAVTFCADQSAQACARHLVKQLLRRCAHKPAVSSEPAKANLTVRQRPHPAAGLTQVLRISRVILWSFSALLYCQQCRCSLLYYTAAVSMHVQGCPCLASLGHHTKDDNRPRRCKVMILNYVASLGGLCKPVLASFLKESMARKRLRQCNKVSVCPDFSESWCSVVSCARCRWAEARAARCDVARDRSDAHRRCLTPMISTCRCATCAAGLRDAALH